MDVPFGPAGHRTPATRSDRTGARPGAPRRRRSWPGTLATAHPGARYRITRLHFDLVRNRCEELGCREGDDVTCLENGRDRVAVSRVDGRRVEVEREYAWFVEVQAVAG